MPYYKVWFHIVPRVEAENEGDAIQKVKEMIATGEIPEDEFQALQIED